MQSTARFMEIGVGSSSFERSVDAYCTVLKMLSVLMSCGMLTHGKCFAAIRLLQSSRHAVHLPYTDKCLHRSLFSQSLCINVLVGIIGQTDNGCCAMADSLLVLVPHKTLHDNVSILMQ